MASLRTYWTPLKVPCEIETSVVGSMRPSALHGDAPVVAAITTAVSLRILRKDPNMQILLSGWHTTVHPRMYWQIVFCCRFQVVFLQIAGACQSHPAVEVEIL